MKETDLDNVPVISALGRKIKEIEERSENEWKRL